MVYGFNLIGKCMVYITRKKNPLKKVSEWIKRSNKASGAVFLLFILLFY